MHGVVDCIARVDNVESGLAEPVDERLACARDRADNRCDLGFGKDAVVVLGERVDRRNVEFPIRVPLAQDGEGPGPDVKD